jgi:hypothetical protein
MNTLIIPCGGKSKRFPNMKPKYLLTHPDGKLMVEKSMEGLDINIFDRIIITIVKPHDEKYEANLILEQVFVNNKKVEICVLDDFTSCASETIIQTVEKKNVKGAVALKDSDNSIHARLLAGENFIVGYSLQGHPYITNIQGKSFLILNEQNIVLDIIEKKIVSDTICIGLYAFNDISQFVTTYHELIDKGIKGELFVSNVISYMLASKQAIFKGVIADDYYDWGTLEEWKKVQRDYRTYFIDVDGVLMRNSGKYGKTNWNNNVDFLEKNIEMIKKLQKNGGQIVITTSRTEEYRSALEKQLYDTGINPYALLMGMNHAARVIINDFAHTNPYPSAVAISLPRNANIEEYL